MIWEWIAEKGTSLLAFLVGLGFVGMAFLDAQYRYFHLCIALMAVAYGYKLLKKRSTPFEKHEREMKRKQL
jgi:hypothetical protein